MSPRMPVQKLSWKVWLIGCWDIVQNSVQINDLFWYLSFLHKSWTFMLGHLIVPVIVMCTWFINHLVGAYWMLDLFYIHHARFACHFRIWSLWRDFLFLSLWSLYARFSRHDNPVFILWSLLFFFSLDARMFFWLVTVAFAFMYPAVFLGFKPFKTNDWYFIFCW